MRFKLGTHVWVCTKRGPVKKKVSQRDQVKRSLGFNLGVTLGEILCNMAPELRLEHSLGEDTVGRDATRHQTDNQQSRRGR